VVAADYWSGRRTVDWMLSVVYAKGAAWNETKWDNPHFNDILVQARSETDEKKRATLYTEAQQLIHDDCGQYRDVLQATTSRGLEKLPMCRHRAIWPQSSWMSAALGIERGPLLLVGLAAAWTRMSLKCGLSTGLVPRAPLA